MKFVRKLVEHLTHLPELAIVYFSPAAGQILWVILAILTDTATGVWAAKKAGEKISSRRLADIAPKMAVYILGLLLAHASDVTFDLPNKFGISALSVVSLAFAGIELKSIDENFEKATGHGVFKKVINAIKRK